MLRLALAAFCALAAATLPARAEPPAEQSDDSDTPAAVEKPAPPTSAPGDDAVVAAPTPYKGVAPGGANLPPRAPKLPLKKGPQRLTWSGFQLKDGVPTVFLEVTGTPDYRVDQSGGALTVTLKNTVAPLRNNRRPLKVEYFKTSVKEVDAAPKGRDLLVTIHLDGADKPSHKERVEPAAGGFQMLVIEIGK
ncbi:MAG TPA: AMIN domain-containing protein [Polyangia bacterium]|nr:AMIN domain-containing protein [Polyangia bacterium]